MDHYYYRIGWTHQEGQGEYTLVSLNSVPPIEFNALMRQQIRIVAKELLALRAGKIEYIGTIGMFETLLPRLTKFGFYQVEYVASFELVEGDTIIFKYDKYHLEPVFGTELFDKLVEHNERVEREVFGCNIGPTEDDMNDVS